MQPSLHDQDQALSVVAMVRSYDPLALAADFPLLGSLLRKYPYHHDAFVKTENVKLESYFALLLEVIDYKFYCKQNPSYLR